MRSREIFTAIGELLTALVARILITPLTAVIPRNPGLCAVIGRENGKFLDNAKHYFCWMQR